MIPGMTLLATALLLVWPPLVLARPGLPATAALCAGLALLVPGLLGSGWQHLLALGLAVLVLAAAAGLVVALAATPRPRGLLALTLGAFLVGVAGTALAWCFDRSWAVLAAPGWGVLGYLGLSGAALAAGCVRSRRRTPPPPPYAVIVLGSSMHRGRMSGLLLARLERARALEEPEAGGGAPAAYVCTGLRREHEPRSEGEAMADYLRSAGIEPGRVVVEDRARTTVENFVRCAPLLPAGCVPVTVTSDFHALRAQRLAARHGVHGPVLGARTVEVSLGPALLRELQLWMSLDPPVLVAYAAGLVVVTAVTLR